MEQRAIANCIYITNENLLLRENGQLVRYLCRLQIADDINEIRCETFYEKSVQKDVFFGAEVVLYNVTTLFSLHRRVSKLGLL